MSKLGCVLNDTQLKDLIDAMKDSKDYSAISYALGDMRERIISALEELRDRRADPTMPDADDLLGIEADAQEAIDDALADTRPYPPYEHHDREDYDPRPDYPPEDDDFETYKSGW